MKGDPIVSASARSAPARTRSKEICFTVILLLATWGLLEGTCAVFLVALERMAGIRYGPVRTARFSEAERGTIQELIAGRTAYVRYSAALGWTIRPRGAAGFYAANSQGLRGDRDYSTRPPKGVVRVATFGDSFTHGDEVGNDETWQAKMEAARPGIEVLNFGVGGFGPDQAYLRYRHEGSSYHPHIVLIGIMSENPNRLVNVYRPFYQPETAFPLTKPRFSLDGERLRLQRNPLPRLSDYERLLREPEELLPRLGEHDYFYQTAYRDDGMGELLPTVRLARVLRFDFWGKGVESRKMLPWRVVRRCDPTSEGHRILIRLLDLFAAEVESHGAIPIVVLFPRMQDIEQYRAASVRYCEPLIAHLVDEKIRYIDLIDAFHASGRDAKMADLSEPHGHYSPQATQIVADHVLRYLDEHELTKAHGQNSLLRGSRRPQFRAREGGPELSRTRSPISRERPRANHAGGLT
jgi:hypothetical protein